MSALVSAAVAAVLVVLPVPASAPARGWSNVPLVHVVGWNRIVSTPGGPDRWEYDAAEHDVAFTLASGESVEVKLGGSCTIDGVTHRSRLFHHAWCRGHGQYGPVSS